jgi:DNA-directed RNA polymerase specialized sigma24 family protein
LNGSPLSEKTAFSLFYYSGFSGKEAAEAMKISEDNFYMKLKAARDRIRTGLKKKGVVV